MGVLSSFLYFVNKNVLYIEKINVHPWRGWASKGWEYKVVKFFCYMHSLLPFAGAVGGGVIKHQRVALKALALKITTNR